MMKLFTAAFEDKTEALNAELKSFIGRLQGLVDLTAVVTLEGLPITHYPPNLPPEVDNTRIAAMTAALLSLGERAMMEVQQGALTRIFVEGDKGYLMSVQAGTRAVLTVSAKAELKLGLLFHDMKLTAEKVGKILDTVG